MEVKGMRRNEEVISFGPEDLKGVNLPHNDALVIQARVANYDFMRVFIDSGSSVNVIFKEALVQMDLQGYHLEAVETALFGFAVLTSFTVVDSPSSYNIILGRLAMNKLRAVASTYHQKIKFPVGARARDVRGDQPSSRKRYVEAVRTDQSKARREGKKARVDKVGGGVMEKGEVHFVVEVEQEVVEVGPGQQIRVAGDLSASTWRLMNKVFEKQLNRSVEVYVDDILGKSKEVTDFITDLEETFATLMHYGIKLNPAKCIFGVKSGKFLGFIATARGIEENQEKVKYVLCMSSPRSVKEVQNLTGRIASLSRFISRSAHRSYPFFQVLRKAQQFGWDEKCE
ncbi:uncharacterized protein LOC142537580 [Primulina tabacum]|uniref:uncharacterized protein LOC142537580 n=1 Tax=Primulina tabacum TaxID=48773 RepID=UPI003F592FD4